MPDSSPEAQVAVPHGQRLITNVLWSWTGVVASLFQGIIITRLLIRSLSEEHYGIWLQIFSILEYFWIFDLGLNSAITNFCARYKATRRPVPVAQDFKRVEGIFLSRFAAIVPEKVKRSLIIRLEARSLREVHAVAQS